MDDMTLFNRFHAAFDVAPPAGGFERLRRELSSYRPDRTGRPAFRMRSSKMGLRLAAVVAVAVIAIAIVGAYLAGHKALLGYEAAGSSQNVAAYQSLVKADHDTFWNQPIHCQPITDPRCKSDGAANMTEVLKWQSDLRSFETPPQFAIIDAQMRLHLQNLTVYMTAGQAALNAGDEATLAHASSFGGNDLTWLDRITNAITTTRVATAAQYTSLLKTEYELGFSCSPPSCDLTAQFAQFCPAMDSPLCTHDIANAFQGIGLVQQDVVMNRAPNELSVRDATLQHDLAQADDALLQMEMAQYRIDAKSLMSARAAFLGATVAISTDLQS